MFNVDVISVGCTNDKTDLRHGTLIANISSKVSL